MLIFFIAAAPLLLLKKKTWVKVKTRKKLNILFYLPVGPGRVPAGSI